MWVTGCRLPVYWEGTDSEVKARHPVECGEEVAKQGWGCYTNTFCEIEKPTLLFHVQSVLSHVMKYVSGRYPQEQHLGFGLLLVNPT